MKKMVVDSRQNRVESAKSVARDADVGDTVEFTWTCKNPSCPVHTAVGKVEHKEEGSVYVLGLVIDSHDAPGLGVHFTAEGEVLTMWREVNPFKVIIGSVGEVLDMAGKSSPHKA